MRKLSLQTTLMKSCRRLGYDHNPLLIDLRHRGIDLEKTKLRTFATERVRPEHAGRTPLLLWPDRNPEKLNRLVAILRDLGIIEDSRRFLELFEHPDSPLHLSLCPEHPDYTLQFFASLKDSKIIHASYCRSIYQVLQFHVNDFEEVFLKGKKPRRRIDGLKKLRSWPEA